MYHSTYNYEDDYFKTIGSIYASTEDTSDSISSWTLWNDSSANAYINGFLVSEDEAIKIYSLIIDGDEIKNWNGSTFTKIGDTPVTEAMLQNYGMT
jgi:hypothetical protein